VVRRCPECGQPNRPLRTRGPWAVYRCACGELYESHARVGGDIFMTEIGFMDELLKREPWPHSLEEIGQAMGITRERVRQIQNKALETLRGECERQGIHWSDFCHAVGFVDESPGRYDRRRAWKREYQRKVRRARA